MVYPRVIDGERVFAAEVDCGVPPVIIQSSAVMTALMALPSQFTRDEANSLWAGLDLSDHGTEGLFEVLKALGLIRSLVDLSASLPSWDAWHRFGWSEAFAYHFGTRDYPFLQMDRPEGFAEDDARMERYVAEEPPPAIYQSFTSLFQVELARVDPEIGPEKALAMMAPREARGLAGLGFLFDLCFGEREKKAFAVQGSFLRKSIPSGGARHPTEIFYAAFMGAPVAAGLYHYNVEAHRLDCIRAGLFEDELEHATFDLFKKFEQRPSGMLIFTSLYERSMWRYRDARSWRAVLIDLGHAAMAFRIVSERLGYSHYTYQKFRDDELTSLLDLGSLRQTPLFVGTLV